MKVLTVKQPWASLIINGYKKYEFRSWKTKYRGKLYIHAGKSSEKEPMQSVKDYGLVYDYGCIIGEVDLIDCILVDEDFNNELISINPLVYGRSNHVGYYAWKLDNVVIYKEPIYMNGQLGLWNVDIDKR